MIVIMTNNCSVLPPPEQNPRSLRSVDQSENGEKCADIFFLFFVDIFFSSSDYSVTTDWKKIRPLSEKLVSLGIMGDQLGVP